MRLFHTLLLVAVVPLGLLGSAVRAADPWLTIPGGEGPGKGKKVVLVSGDEEYRSEEALPQLAKILAKHHGFECTVLFAIDPKDGTINPEVTNNIPGLEALDHADLMIIATRFRNLPDDQMKHVADYLSRGGPVIGLRTATHAFNLKSKTYAKYSFNSKEPDWQGGFGRHILGETWVNHWGSHGRQSTRGIVEKGEEHSPLLRGIGPEAIWCPTDVYEAHPPSDCQTLVRGAVLEGMKPADQPIAGPKNDPMMPIAWIRSYETDSGKSGRVFTTTMGASQDLQNEELRRLLVNATYWALGMENKIPEKAHVELVGEYRPSPFKFGGHQKGVHPEDLAK